MSFLPTYRVDVDDWLVVYTWIGGELDGHQAVRHTKSWKEWGRIRIGEYADSYELEEATDRVVEKAYKLGPPPHDQDERGSCGWCGECATNFPVCSEDL